MFTWRPGTSLKNSRFAAGSVQPRQFYAAVIAGQNFCHAARGATHELQPRAADIGKNQLCAEQNTSLINMKAKPELAITTAPCPLPS